MANVVTTSADDYIIHLASSETSNSGWKFRVQNAATPLLVLLEVGTNGGMTIQSRLVSDGVKQLKNTGSGDLAQFKRSGTTYVAVKSDGLTDATYAGARLHHASTNPDAPVDGDAFWKVDGGGSHTLRVYYGGGWVDFSTTAC